MLTGELTRSHAELQFARSSNSPRQRVHVALRSIGYSMTAHAPATEAEAGAMIAETAARRTPLAVSGGATKAGIGRPAQTEATLSSAALTGVTLYEPAELVIAARAGTPLSEVVRTLAEKGQQLPFEPMDYRPLLGSTGEPTIGAIAATNISGPRRIMAGAAR